MNTESLRILGLLPSEARLVSGLADLCYIAALTEDLAAVENKILLFPKGCFGCWQGEQLIGYLLSFPWRRGSSAPLNKTIEIPSNPDCLYIHDLGVNPAARGCGAGKALFQELLAMARRDHWQCLSLTAVQGAESYWSRLGFQTVQKCLYSGEPAALMELFV